MNHQDSWPQAMMTLALFCLTNTLLHISQPTWNSFLPPSSCSNCSSNDDKVSPVHPLQPSHDNGDEAEVPTSTHQSPSGSLELIGEMRRMNHTMDRMLRLHSVWNPIVLMMKVMFPSQLLSNKSKRIIRRVHH